MQMRAAQSSAPFSKLRSQAIELGVPLGFVTRGGSLPSLPFSILLWPPQNVQGPAEL